MCTSVNQKRRTILITALLILLLFLLMFVSLFFGPVSFSIDDILSAIKTKLNYGSQANIDIDTKMAVNIIFKIRFPRILIAAISGATLSLVGIVMQTITENPMAAPYILGISSGASAGAVSSIYSESIQNSETTEGKIDKMKNNPTLKDITAVKEDNFIPVKLSEITPGVRSVDALERLANQIREL